MAKTDKEKKEIIAHYSECQNYSETARKYNMSVNAIKNIVLNNEETAKLCKQKNEENTQDVLQAMKKRSEKKIEIVDKIFEAMDGKLENIDMFTNIKDLATAYGIIMDKELKVVELDLKKQEIENKKNDNKDTLDKLDEVLKNIGGVV